MKMMTSRATTQRVSTSKRMCTSMLLSAVVAAVGAGEFELGRSGDLCLHMGAEQAIGLLSWDWWCWSRHVQLTPHE